METRRTREKHSLRPRTKCLRGRFFNALSSPREKRALSGGIEGQFSRTYASSNFAYPKAPCPGLPWQSTLYTYHGKMSVTKTWNAGAKPVHGGYSHRCRGLVASQPHRFPPKKLVAPSRAEPTEGRHARFCYDPHSDSVVGALAACCAYVDGRIKSGHDTLELTADFAIRFLNRFGNFPYKASPFRGNDGQRD